MSDDPNEKIRYRDNNIYGSAVYMSRRTAAHLDATQAKLADKHPGSRVAIIQGAYNDGVPASAGTHDYDAVLDVYIPGWPYSETQRFLRADGWAAWTRSPPSFGWHVHMVSLGYTTRVGIYVPGQVADYYARKTGLVGHLTDNSWHPPDIKATIFDYSEDDMPTVKDILDAPLGPKHTVRDALLASLDVSNALSEFRANSRERDAALAARMDAVVEGGKDDATKKELRNVRDVLLERVGDKDTTGPDKPPSKP